MKKNFSAFFFLFCLFATFTACAQTTQRTTYATNDLSVYFKNVLAFGKSKGWSTILFDERLNVYMAQHSVADQTRLASLINSATTPSAKFFALKSFLGGDVEATVQRFVAQLNALPEQQQQDRCTVFHLQGLAQKWQYSCSIAVVLTYLADLCPRYAFEVKMVPGYDQAISNPQNPMAVQEKQLLEQYGGKASPRGDVSGKAIGINEPINAMVGRVLGVQFYAKQVAGSVGDALNNIRSLLDAGMNVPALVDFLPSHAAHFVLFFREKYEAGQYWYLVYEPWEGKCSWVSTSNITANSFSPLLSQWRIQLTWYYPTR